MTANLLLQDGWEPGRPSCYNRPPREPGHWARNGWFRGKPVVRWVPRWSEDRCAAWDGRGIGPGGEPYPVAHGWTCTGCRWLPFNAEVELLFQAAAAQRARAGRDSLVAKRIDGLIAGQEPGP